MTARFKVLHAGPFVSVQDAGRHGYRRYGVTCSGAMDRFSHAMANTAIDQHAGNAALEISLGGLEIECTEGSVVAALAGGSFNITLDGKQLSSCSSFIIQQGSVLRVRPGEWGSWCYLSFAGDLQSASWLGSQSVHLNSGLCGKPLVAGNEIEIANARSDLKNSGNFQDAGELKPVSTLRAVLGPQDRYFEQQSIDALFSQEFKITADYNRMGVRLSGPTLKIAAALDMPSEPIARGSLQVPGHGDPLLLLADHQTTGGYPKIATVISCDQDKFAQLRSGDSVRFERIDVKDAVDAARHEHKHRQTIFESFALNSVSLEERLANSNLISGVADASD